MWRKLKNIFASFKTYDDLSPDLQIRQQVNGSLRDRPSLTADEWFTTFWQPLQISRPVADFVYTHLPNYSGLEFARVRPDDQLCQDLKLPLVCWFDWELSLCEDFWQCFGIDLSDRFNPDDLMTVQDLIFYLEHQLLPLNHS